MIGNADLLHQYLRQRLHLLNYYEAKHPSINPCKIEFKDQ